MSDPPLHGIAVYNPDLLSRDELVRTFVARDDLLALLLEDLRRETDGAPQHHLIVGHRGMGKTTLLRRLRYAIEDDAALEAWLPLVFPEEQYNVVRLSDLWLNCVDALVDTLEQQGGDVSPLDRRAAEVHALDDEEQRATAALELLMAGAPTRRFVLLIDNLDLVLDRIEDQQWALREVLSSEARLLLVGATSRGLETTFTYDKAFYDFFRSHHLTALDDAQAFAVLRRLAEVGDSPDVARVLDEDPARIRALRVLSGGNPRTIVLLYGVLAQGTAGDVRSDLERLLDHCTPLYKARFEAMPAQAQQVVDAIAVHWDPITAADLAERVRLPVNTVSAQLNRLVNQGVVEKVPYHPGRRLAFQLAERFFNIWYLMRASRRVRRRLAWLVECLKLLYVVDAEGRRALHSPAPPLASPEEVGKARSEPGEGDESLARELARSASVAEVRRLLGALGGGDRWRPFGEALAAVDAGTRHYLRRLAPEVRDPTETLLARLGEELES